MWTKPREISDGAYQGFGYEISYGSSGQVTPDDALRAWKRSQGHHEVIVNKGIWFNARWHAMGVAVTGGYALVWFGKEADPAK
ncbi:hypothetical protein RA210_U610001 [Rubrivivax sp. A210]|nr:hypothetical protein RA210_U610001 [Rubrivivax sp. A210]